MSEIPIIDANDLTLLGKACREVGFFYLTGHGVPTAGIFAAARTFFTQPAEAKEALSIQRSPNNRGYIGVGHERLDQNTPPDQKEAFNIGLELPHDDPELLARKPFRGVNFWPELTGWRATALAYYEACTELTLTIHRGFARDLGLDADYFTTRLHRPMSTLRLLRYPPGQEGPGAGTHTDYGNLTILATDGVAGLQVRRRDGAWIDAPHVPDAFVCNIGDTLMRWTNDIYVSTPHRVVRPARERYSIAYFADPNPDALVETLPACLAYGETAKYQPITAGAYLTSRLDASYEHRSSGKDRPLITEEST